MGKKLDARYMREMYNASLQGSQYKNDYEFYRWFFHRYSWEDYRMMYLALRPIVDNLKFSSCLEVGPGPGTWTKLLLQKSPNAHFVLIDNSDEMIKQAKMNLGERKNITFIAADFSQTKVVGSFDVVFSSRTIEYIPEKEVAIEKIMCALKKGGKGIIVTKNPNSFGRILTQWVGRRLDMAHSAQISHEELVRIIEERGGRLVQVVPCSVALPPVWRWNWLSRKIWGSIINKPLTRMTSLFSESYIVTFVK